MGSTGKKKTTMAKLARESRLRERRLEKEARKEARKHAAAHPPVPPNDAPNRQPAIGRPSPTEGCARATYSIEQLRAESPKHHHTLGIDAE